MRVLVADLFEQTGIEALRAKGFDVLLDPDLGDETLRAAIRREAPQVLVVRGTKVSADMLEGSSIGLVVRAGAGLNTIDVEGAKRLGIEVANCPGLNAIAVAELTMALILALDRRIPENVADLRAGRWNKREYSKAAGLYGRTIGLIGFGRIGEEVARRAQVFGMRVLVWSRRFAEGNAEIPPDLQVDIVPTPEALAERSDVLSVHLALTPETRGFVGAAILQRLRPNAMFVNTARAEVVDAAALADAVKSRGLRVAVDVFAGEPSQPQGDMTDPLVQLPNVIGTHHIGGSTDQAQEAIAQEVVRIIQHWSKGKT